MIGIIIAAHADLGTALVESARLLCGNAEQIHTIGLYHGDDSEELKQKLNHAVTACQEDEGILILTDLYGGTPCNVAAQIIHENWSDCQIALYAGVNVPMVVTAVMYRDSFTLEEMVTELNGLAHESICNVKEKLGMA